METNLVGQYFATKTEHHICNCKVVLLLCDTRPSSMYPQSTKQDIWCASFRCCVIRYHTVHIYTKQSWAFDVRRSVVVWYSTIQYVSTINKSRHTMYIVLLLCDMVPSSTYLQSTKWDIWCASFWCYVKRYHPVRIRNQQSETFDVRLSVTVWYGTIQYASKINKARHAMGCHPVCIHNQQREIGYHHPVCIHNQQKETFNVIGSFAIAASFFCCAIGYHPVHIHNQQSETFVPARTFDGVT
jgi:hypothetical protein